MLKTGEIYYGGPLRITDQDGLPVTTLVDSDFTKHVFLNGEPNDLQVVVKHLENGNYQGSMLPPTAGTWTMIFTQATYAIDGFADNIQVEEYSFRPIPVDQVVQGDANAILDSILPGDFQTYFFRDFNYLPAYSSTKGYFKDDIVTITTLGVTNFYKCLLTSVIGVPPYPATDPATWQLVSGNVNDYILDIDISKAFDQARAILNPEIFDNDLSMVDAYYYATAHYLSMDIRMAESGIDSRGEGLINSKSVGSVSVSYNQPDIYNTDPTFAYMAQTAYGLKYLSYILPRLVGRVGIAEGWTTP